MVRRIDRYAPNQGWDSWNLISTIGSFVLAVGILLTLINVVHSARKGKRSGNDPWLGNTLEWFTSSPPPQNNFDVIPRVRSVNPMQDIRREVAAAQGKQAGSVAQPLV
jgi:cytochrome c oxidase subunit 1